MINYSQPHPEFTRIHKFLQDQTLLVIGETPRPTGSYCNLNLIPTKCPFFNKHSITNIDFYITPQMGSTALGRSAVTFYQPDVKITFYW